MPEDLLRPVKNQYLAKLLAEGTSTSPIGSHWQGAARLVQGLLGGIEQGREDTKDAALTAAFQKLLGNEPAAPVGGSPVAAGAPSAMPAPTMPQRVTTTGQPIGTPSTPRVIGDVEGVRTGIYDAAPGGGAATQPATFNDRFSTPAPQGARTVPTVPQIDPRNRAGASLLWAGGERGKAIEMATKKPDAPTYGDTGQVDQFGRPVKGWINAQNQTITVPPGTPQGGGFKEATELRGELQKQPNYRKHQDAVGVYDSMFRSAGLNNPVADIDLVSGLAKIMDPVGSVQQGEAATIQNAQGLSEKIKGQLQSILEGKGTLTTETRAQLMEIARNRVEGYRGAAAADVTRYKGHAKRYGIDPEAVAYDIPETPAWTPPKPTPAPKGAAGPKGVSQEVIDAAIAELKRREGKK